MVEGTEIQNETNNKYRAKLYQIYTYYSKLEHRIGITYLPKHKLQRSLGQIDVGNTSKKNHEAARILYLLLRAGIIKKRDCSRLIHGTHS